MDNKRKRKVDAAKSDVPKRIKRYLESKGKSVDILTPENIVDEILNSPLIVDKV